VGRRVVPIPAVLRSGFRAKGEKSSRRRQDSSGPGRTTHTWLCSAATQWRLIGIEPLPRLLGRFPYPRQLTTRREGKPH